MLNILSYLLILILTFIYAYIFDVKESYILFYMMLLMPIFDFICFRMYKNKLQIETEVKTEYMVKNQTNFYKVKFQNKSILPLVYFSYEVKLGDKLESDTTLNGANSLRAKKECERNIVFKAKNIGLNQIVLHNIEIKSLFGLFYTRIKDEVNCCEVKIMPNIVGIEKIQSLIEDEINYDGELETSMNVFKGEPGYEYKEYSEGDSLNKVNWKLSSKMGSLFIRRDESYAKCKKIIVLDSHVIKSENDLYVEDLLLEGALGTINEMLSYSFEVSLCYQIRGQWINKSINSEDDIKILQKSFASYQFIENKSRFKDICLSNEENIDLIIFTCNKDKEVLELINSFNNITNSVYIVSNNRNRLQEAEFYLTRDYSLERMRNE